MADCIFCKIAKGEIPSATVFENDDVRVIMDIGPAAKGHAIMLAKKHIPNIYELDPEDAAKIFSVAPKIAKAVQKTTGADGINVLQNNGEASGQTVFHLHVHFIPRFKGDSVQVGWKPGEYADGEAAKLAEEIKKNI